jgi:hypothetical protein
MVLNAREGEKNGFQGIETDTFFSKKVLGQFSNGL